MILYDQDFRFIGMSVETLTFLGYEDIDEFTSMHSDFADLFVKKEGFIHKFENFSWIHYVLYSGAANKKAYVARKNGEEICVDITIKEVFLNHTYDGLRTIYSVKLINENFTKISHSDVHDNRSATSGKNQFSLNSLTKNLNLPEEPAIQEEPAEAPANTTPVPEPLDFKLDIPEDSILATPAADTPEPALQKPEIDVPLFDAPDTAAPFSEPKEEPKTEEPTFTLNFPEPQTTETEEEPPSAHIDFGAPAVKNEEVESTPAPQPTEERLSETFKLNFPTIEEPKKAPVELNFDLPLDKEDTTQKPQTQPQTVQLHEEHEEEVVKESEPEHKDIFSFQLLKEQHQTSSETAQSESAETVAPQPDETLLKLHEPAETATAPATEASVELLREESTQTPPEEEEKEDEQKNNIFNFNFLQNSAAQDEKHEEPTEEKEAAAPQSAAEETTVPLSDLLKPESADHEATQEEKKSDTQFSFNLFKETPEEENNASFLAARAEESKSTLIDQIKHDIEVIDQDVQIEPSEKEEAGQKLESLVHESMQEQQQEQQELQEQPQPFTFDYQPAEASDNSTGEIEIAVKPDFPEEIPQHEENSFEETLKNIFSTAEKLPQPEETALNDIEQQKPVHETKQSITTEAIKSPDQNEAPSPEALVLPKLGNLGLSREEELDFIEEFLDDTAATVGLMQEYLKLEDYSNIKYNLIKIASSADILHFDQMLAHTKELTALCDAAQKEGVAEKLQKLLQLAKRYKAHFSSMPV